MNAPARGEVWLVDPGMATKVRPALVISVPADDADRALVTLVPHTTSVRGARFEAVVSLSFLKAGAFDAQNLITIPHAKLLRVLGKLIRSNLARSNLWCGSGWGWPHPRHNTEMEPTRQFVRAIMSPRRAAHFDR